MFKIKKLSLLLLIAFLVSACGHAPEKQNAQPKLLVGVVIDQMRYDYLYRFYEQYGDNGFKRLMHKGMNFTYAHFNYVPTYTGPGHASIYTGTTPYYHGIISNDWYDRSQKKVFYCVSDTAYQTIGSANGSGKMSPHRLKTSTIGDQLRMSNNGLSRVFAASIKDRASILPGGHMANAAYWYDGDEGNFVSSSYYMDLLPDWVTKFNAEQVPAKLMSTDWTLSLAEKEYEIVMPDNGPGEKDVFGEGDNTFPHSFDKKSDLEKLDLIKSTPYGNTLLTDFVINLMKQEELGKGKYPDMLAVSYSSPDYIGHSYGPNSVEIMDTYVKMDQELARLFAALDAQVGAGNYLLFLTADHAVKPNAAYLEANRVPTGFIRTKLMKSELNDFAKAQFDVDNLVETIESGNIYLDHKLLLENKLKLRSVSASLVTHMLDTYPELATIVTSEELRGKYPERSMSNFILNGFNPVQSGDIIFDLRANYGMSDNTVGTTHGTSFDYDTHVPLLFYGWHIHQGESNKEVYVEDIAPTLASIMRIQEPEGTFGVPIIKPYQR